MLSYPQTNNDELQEMQCWVATVACYSSENYNSANTQVLAVQIEELSS
jgi:hypothetical protein